MSKPSTTDLHLHRSSMIERRSGLERAARHAADIGADPVFDRISERLRLVSVRVRDIEEMIEAGENRDANAVHVAGGWAAHAEKALADSVAEVEAAERAKADDGLSTVVQESRKRGEALPARDSGRTVVRFTVEHLTGPLAGLTTPDEVRFPTDAAARQWVQAILDSPVADRRFFGFEVHAA